MSIFNSVVGKLWMTIIGLVAVVLIILGFFLFQYIDNSIPNVSNQKTNLVRLTNQITEESSYHTEESGYYTAMSDLLETQDAGMILLEQGSYTPDEILFTTGEKAVKLGDLLSEGVVNNLFRNGELVSGQFSSSVSPWHGGYIYAAKAISDSSGTGEPTQAVVVYQSMQSVEDTQMYVKRLFALVSIMGFLMTTFFAFFLITRITRPLTELKIAADSITRGDYGKRVPVVSSDEIGELTQTFNLMGEQLEGTIQDLHHEKQNLASVLHSMGDAVISFDNDGRIIFINPLGERVLEEWTGLSWEEDTRDAAVAEMPASIPEPLQELYQSAVKEMRGVSSRIHVKNNVWSVVLAPLYAGEQVRGIVAVLRDVTEESRLESLGKVFVANVSHELRTPIAMLQGYSEALLDDMVSSVEERQELVQIIHDESLRMGRLVKDLLDLAKMENGRMEMKLTEVDLSSLLNRVHRKFSALCKEQEIGLELHLPEQPLHLQQGDEDRLEQVMTNLLDNAIRHTHASANINVHGMLEPDGQHIRIVVEDEGEGIPQEALPNIFERFYKADKARTRGVAGGTGLGLAIVKNIIDVHQGTITVNSVLGQGTTFSILLPVKRK